MYFLFLSHISNFHLFTELYSNFVYVDDQKSQYEKIILTQLKILRTKFYFRLSLARLAGFRIRIRFVIVYSDRKTFLIPLLVFF